ncbi:hypothetical protein [Caudoviricetes sp.]|nr:hypothetical protein [Caudoviricetes sp.]
MALGSAPARPPTFYSRRRPWYKRYCSLAALPLHLPSTVTWRVLAGGRGLIFRVV